eukprot:752875-Hanusia_phi.AAC.2
MESRFDCFSTASHSNTVLLSLIPCCYNLNAPSLSPSRDHKSCSTPCNPIAETNISPPSDP